MHSIRGFLSLGHNRIKLLTIVNVLILGILITPERDDLREQFVTIGKAI